MLQGYSSVVQALLGTFFTWAMTAAGAALVFIFSSGQRRILDGSLGFAAGGATEDPQTALALNLDPALMKKSDPRDPTSLLFPESELSIRIDKRENGEVYQRKKVAATDLAEGVAPSGSMHGSSGQPGGSSWRRIALLILAITIHNIPEGLAVGVGFGAVEKTASATFESASPDLQPVEQCFPTQPSQSTDSLTDMLREQSLPSDSRSCHNNGTGSHPNLSGSLQITQPPKASLSATVTMKVPYVGPLPPRFSERNLAIGIGIQNFPEGLAVSLPLRGAGFSTWKAFWYGQLSGMVEPLAGVFGAFAVVLAEPILPYALAFAAGAMVYVVMDDIIPEAQISGNGKLASWASILGFVVMMSLDVGLG